MPGLMFHHFHGPGHPVQQGSLSADDLRRIIDRRKPAQAAEWLPGSGRDVLTFDDGLLCQYDIAVPVLNEYRLTAFFFVYTAPLVGVVSRLEVYRRVRTTMFPTVDDFYDAFGPVRDATPGYLEEHTYLSQRDRDFRFYRDLWAPPGQYEARMDGLIRTLGHTGHTPETNLWMTSGQVRELAATSHIIGTHSHSHPTKMSSLTTEAMEIEYATSTWILEHIIRRRPTAMSHPCNQYTTEGLAYLQKIGYTLGFRATPGTLDLLTHTPMRLGPLEVPRIDSADLIRVGA